jgi:exopolysaccharide production protein ExoQ
MQGARDFFTIFTILFLTGINFDPLAPRSVDSLVLMEGNWTTQVIKSVLYVVAFFLLLLKWKRAARISANNTFIWIVLLWVFASTAWSEEPAITLRRSIGLFGTTIIALYLATYYDYNRFSRIARYGFLIAFILSLALIVFYPDLGVSTFPSGWRGIYFTKNGLGISALFGVILSAGSLKDKRGSLFGIASLILGLILLGGTKSVTSLTVLTFAIAIWLVLWPLIHKNIPMFVWLASCLVLLVLFGICIYISNNAAGVLNTLGKDVTLTGRIPIWESALSYIWQRPWTGYGYGAVWLGRDFGIGSFISDPLHYYVVNAHNGYLDLLLEIGTIGVALLLVTVFGAIYKIFCSVKSATHINGVELWPLVFLIALILYNSTEAMLLVQNSLAWTLVSFLEFRAAADHKIRIERRLSIDSNRVAAECRDTRIKPTL